MSFTDLTGRTLGTVKILGRTQPKISVHSSVVWDCLCICGNITQFNSSQLSTLKLPNCGCLRNMEAPPNEAPRGSRWIALTKGKYALVDEADYDAVSQHSWTAFPTKNYQYFYASNLHLGRMHRWLVGAARGVLVDHKDRNPLNNRRDNLRVCTYRQNSQNKGRRSDSRAPFKGIHWRSGYWDASIQINGKTHQLGRFTDPESAAIAYDSAAKEHYGEFACCNFPETKVLNILPGGAKTPHEIGSKDYEREARFAETVRALENARFEYWRMEQIVYEMRARRGDVIRKAQAKCA